MAATSTRDGSDGSEPPLWSIGLAVAVILGTPLVLYSLAPTGPLREGDTAFSNGQQRVHLTTPTAEPRLQPGDTCLLDPNSPLIVVHAPDGQPDGSIIGLVQGNPATEWPFCPVHAEVVIQAHQLFQKPSLLTEIQGMLVGLLSR
jgi:hypothetical protein